MKQLVIVRHGTAVKGGSFADICRPLKKNGVIEILNTSTELKKHKVSFSHIYTSPAARCYDTSLILATEFNIEYSNILLLPSMYMSNSKTLLHVVSQFDNKQQQLCIVGHNPGLDELIASFQFKQICYMEKGDAMVLQSKATRWSRFFEVPQFKHYFPAV